MEDTVIVLISSVWFCKFLCCFLKTRNAQKTTEDPQMKINKFKDKNIDSNVMLDKTKLSRIPF